MAFLPVALQSSFTSPLIATITLTMNPVFFAIFGTRCSRLRFPMAQGRLQSSFTTAFSLHLVLVFLFQMFCLFRWHITGFWCLGLCWRFGKSDLKSYC